MKQLYLWWGRNGEGGERERERERENNDDEEEEVIMRLTDLIAKQLFHKSVHEVTRTAPN